MHYTATFRKRLSPRVPGHPVWVSRGGQRHGYSGAPCSRSSTQSLWCLFSTILSVPQMVDNVLYAFRLLDRPIAEQVIEVPKISCSPCPSHVPSFVPQMAEQLVEVPTVLTPTRIALRIAEQIVNTPVLQGRVQGLLPEQSSTASSSSLERISERTVEQIVDIPSSGRGLRQVSSSSAGLADEDFTWVFRTFPRGKKVLRLQPSRVRACPPVSAHGLGRLMRTWICRRAGDTAGRG